jgi:sialate O-acetylesterase
MRKTNPFIAAVLFLIVPFVLGAQVRLPQLIADHMVLQRDVVNPIWGWAAPAEKIVLVFNGRKYKTTAAADGSWQVLLPGMRAGGPYNLDIRGRNHLVVSDILLGDVWFCSGQGKIPGGGRPSRMPDDPEFFYSDGRRCSGDARGLSAFQMDGGHA